MIILMSKKAISRYSLIIFFYYCLIIFFAVLYYNFTCNIGYLIFEDQICNQSIRPYTCYFRDFILFCLGVAVELIFLMFIITASIIVYTVYWFFYQFLLNHQQRISLVYKIH